MKAKKNQSTKSKSTAKSVKTKKSTGTKKISKSSRSSSTKRKPSKGSIVSKAKKNRSRKLKKNNETITLINEKYHELLKLLKDSTFLDQIKKVEILKKVEKGLESMQKKIIKKLK